MRIIKTIAKSKKGVFCLYCNERIYSCNDCNNGVLPESVIYCNSYGHHCCEKCFNQKKKVIE